MYNDDKVVNKTISATILVYYYDKYAEEYGNTYPEVKNPNALVQGIEEVTRAIGDGIIPDNTLLYVIEDEEDKNNPMGAQYVIMITKGNKIPSENENKGFAIRLFYTKTREIESVSTFESDKIIWSPDDMSNTRHPNRTKYYLGFAYMLCEKSPGFDREPMPEVELTGAELIALGVEGELPPEIIEISLPEQSETEQKEAIEEETMRDIWEDEEDEFDFFTEDSNANAEVPDEDDTEIIIESPYDMEDEYDDLEIDYEELFE